MRSLSAFLALAFLAGCGPAQLSAPDPSVNNDDPHTVRSTLVYSQQCQSCGGECTEDVLSYPPAEHVDGAIDYEDPPPAGGNHNACWASWGVHTEVVHPENWVHNLEHGGVVFLYSCSDGCPAEVSELASYVETLPAGRAVLTEDDDMPTRFAAVAWDHRLLLGCFDLAALSAFFDAHAGAAPEDDTAEPSPGCM